MAEDDPTTPGPQAPEQQPAPAPAVEHEEHDTTGLDLARSLARSAKGSPARRRTASARRARRGPDLGPDPRAGRIGTGAHPDDRDPQTISSAVSRVVDQHGWAGDLRAHGVFARWPEIVGAEIGAHSRPESFADGTLVVGADSTAWATQLRLLAPSLVRRLNEELGHGAVTVIDVRGPNLPSWSRGPRAVRGGRGPRDTYG